jgi:hypothetical protein
MAGAVCYEEQDFVGETVRDLFDTVILAARSPPHPCPTPAFVACLKAAGISSASSLTRRSQPKAKVSGARLIHARCKPPKGRGRRSRISFPLVRWYRLQKKHCLRTRSMGQVRRMARVKASGDLHKNLHIHTIWD